MALARCSAAAGSRRPPDDRRRRPELPGGDSPYELRDVANHPERPRVQRRDELSVRRDQGGFELPGASLGFRELGVAAVEREGQLPRRVAWLPRARRRGRRPRRRASGHVARPRRERTGRVEPFLLSGQGLLVLRGRSRGLPRRLLQGGGCFAVPFTEVREEPGGQGPGHRRNRTLPALPDPVMGGCSRRCRPRSAAWQAQRLRQRAVDEVAAVLQRQVLDDARIQGLRAGFGVPHPRARVDEQELATCPEARVGRCEPNSG